jgi:transcriptional regulator
MKKELIDIWLRAKLLRKRQADKSRITSMIKTAEMNVRVIRKLPLEEENATVIFREIYESIRQLGDAKW